MKSYQRNYVMKEMCPNYGGLLEKGTALEIPL